MITSNDYSCLVNCMEWLLGVPAEHILKVIGHDGSKAYKETGIAFTTYEIGHALTFFDVWATHYDFQIGRADIHTLPWWRLKGILCIDTQHAIAVCNERLWDGGKIVGVIYDYMEKGVEALLWTT